MWYNRAVLRGVAFMAQVLVNFRIDEDVKKSMEQACREMGLSMSTAFTVFAKKVGKEKRIPFEITAEPQGPGESRPPRREPEQIQGEDQLVFVRKQERLELLCAGLRRSLTSIHTAIPSSITGLSMERIRLLCGDELKDKVTGISGASRTLFSHRNAEMLRTKDSGILDEYIDALSSISQDLLVIEHTLIPAMKAWSGTDTGCFAPYEQELAEVSRRLDGLGPVMQRFLCSTAQDGGARGIKARIRKAARVIETPYVLTALETLEALILRDYDSLEEETRARLESCYFPTLELTLRELEQAEQGNEDVSEKAALCLRVINVLSRVISEGRQAQKEWNGRNLEAEVVAMERLAAMRGDIAEDTKPEA